MKELSHSAKKGISFGLTSGIITTLGLMVGLASSTQSQLAVVGGIVVIAVADALSDAFGMHISEEAENVHTHAEIWEATFATFLSKFAFACTFLVPVLLLPLDMAVIASIIWGALLISGFSYKMAQDQKEKEYKVVAEHLAILALVVIATYFIGELVGALF